MRKPAATITLERVAEQASVTTMTISRFFKTPQLVAPATRQRIQQTIDALGYVPDTTAARLAGKARPMLAIVAPSLELPYVSEIIEGVAAAADHVDAALMVFETRFSPDIQEQRIETAISWRPSGIVFIGDTVSDRSRRQIVASGIPFIEAWASSEEPAGIDIGLSHRDIAAQLTGGLIGAGYQRIAFGVRRLGYRIEDERLDGYLDAIRAAGRAPSVIDIPDQGNHYAAGAKILRDSQAMHPRPDALFLAGDILAAGAIFECYRMSVRVPDDLAICGIGDFAISTAIVPSLTTASLPTRSLGYEAARRCLDGAPPAQTMDQVRLIERESARLKL